MGKCDKQFIRRVLWRFRDD